MLEAGDQLQGCFESVSSGDEPAAVHGGRAACAVPTTHPTTHFLHHVPSALAVGRMFSHTIHTTVDIAASPSRVWQLLVADGMGSGSWNPFITRLEGALTEGSVLSATAAIPGYPDYKFRPTVTCGEQCAGCRSVGGSWRCGVAVRRACETAEPTPNAPGPLSRLALQ